MSRSRMPLVTLGTTRLVVERGREVRRSPIARATSCAVAEGTVRFCLGYTEPDGGSDIAAAKVRAALTATSG